MTASIMVPFPLRPDFVATVDVPRDMTSAEAARLAAFVRTLAMDAPPHRRLQQAGPLADGAQPARIEFTEEWCTEKAKQEAGHEVGVGAVCTCVPEATCPLHGIGAYLDATADGAQPQQESP